MLHKSGEFRKEKKITIKIHMYLKVNTGTDILDSVYNKPFEVIFTFPTLIYSRLNML